MNKDLSNEFEMTSVHEDSFFEMCASSAASLEWELVLSLFDVSISSLDMEI